MLVFWSSMIPLSAQITLHEATNVTQTKATLSADFPDLNSEHGFQYKYGTLPEIDEFSKIALAPLSDPVQLITSPTMGWTARNAKGWIESKTSVPVGQASSFTTNIVLTEPSEISFDWSVDSEDNIGILSFLVDGIEVKSITGLIGFTTVTYSIAKGEHSLTWQYIKKKETNIGLDLAKLKNLFIPNTTFGIWKEIYGNNVCIENLNPASSILFRAFDSSGLFSQISSFNTLNIKVNNISIQNCTQTTAVISREQNLGDFESSCYIGLVDIEYDDSRLYALLSPKTYGIPIELTGYSNRSVNSNCLYGRNIGVYVTLEQPTEISFEAYGQMNQVARFYLDDYYDYNGLIIKSVDNIVDEDDPALFTKYTFLVPAGRHHLGWDGGANGKWVGNVCVKNLEIPGGEKHFASIYPVTGQSTFTITLDNLLSDKVYRGICSLTPLNESDMNFDWEHCEKFQFSTQKIIASTSGVENLKQGSCKITGRFAFGGATILACGLKYRSSGGDWIDLPQEINSHISSRIERLRPGTSYEYCCYAKAEKCDTVFSESSTFKTLTVTPNVPLLIRLSQHEATLQGSISYGDANIYTKGMQFRKKGAYNWEEIEDGGEDSIYTLIRKNLEMGAAYQARTYVQPAGCDIIYSDILEFNTLDNYFKGYLKSPRTQTTVEFSATLADLDENITAEEYGFEYYLDSDGFFENASDFVKSDIIRVPVVPENGQIKTTITGLTPSYGLRFRAYTKIHGEYIYYTGYKDWKWDFAGTERATISVTIKKITQTSISLALDAKQNGDAQVSQIEYALANSVEETQPYSVCGNTLTLANLTPDKQYNLRFRGLVNNRYCPLLKEISWDYSWFEYNTLPVDVNVVFSNITQTKAKMNIDINAGDAIVSNLKYQIGNGDIKECSKNNLLTDLMPGQTYAVTIYANINGEELSWNTNASDEPFKFTTKTVSSYISISDISQTSAKLKCSSNFGDATYLSSGLEFGDIIFDSENQDFEEIMTELLPSKSYSCRSFVETKESGRVYSSSRTFTTRNIECETRPVSNISNRSATMNGTIDCDSYSSAEFGFQWKQMEGWQSEPAFTKGRKLDDGTISVALTNGMLEPNTDYQYRAAVRYQDHIYYAPNWITFRTESEFVYYPASVYTVLRTDRENNTLVLCGYYIAGSETIVSQGYEYWQTSKTHLSRAPQSPTVITTDESMHHLFAVGEIPSGNYNVRAFVKTETGTTIYGATLSFSATSDGYSGIAEIKTEQASIATENGIVKLYNAIGLDCFIYSLSGQIIANKKIDCPYYEVRLTRGNFYIVTLSNGITKKVKL